jgi:hypothetical protein
VTAVHPNNGIITRKPNPNPHEVDKMSMNTFLNSLLGLACAVPFGLLVIKIADFITGSLKEQ